MAERPRGGRDRPLDVLRVDVEMGDRPQVAGARGGGEQHALLRQQVRALVDRQPERSGIEQHEVRLDLLEVDRQARGRERLGEPPRARVVVREPLDVVVERVDPGRRDDPRLAHRAAEEVLAPRALAMSSREPARSAPSGQPSPFERQSVTVSNSRPDSAAGTPSATTALSSRAPSRWTREPELARGRDDVVELVERPHAAAAAVVGVLERRARRAR